jgi:hypothetical protein
MSGFNHLRAAVAGAVLTALAATACDTATAGPEDDPGVTEPFEELTRIYPPTNIPRIYPPTDPYVPADRTGAGVRILPSPRPSPAREGELVSAGDRA